MGDLRDFQGILHFPFCTLWFILRQCYPANAHNSSKSQ